MVPPKLQQATPANRASAWVWVAMNQLALPGLGTILAGRRVGYVQAALAVVGFLLVLGYALWVGYAMVQLLQTGDETAWHRHYRQHCWVLLSGLGLSLIAWFWALASSLRILRARPPAAHN